MSRTAAELREQAAAHRAEAAASWERSDTDGCLSQWASGINARLADAQAEIAENGGMATFARYVLTRDADGREMEVRDVKTRFGYRWRIEETDEWMAQTARAAKRKGYTVTEVIETAEAAAVIAGSGTGLSGATSCYVRTYRRDAAKSAGWRCVGIAGDDRAAEYRGTENL